MKLLAVREADSSPKALFSKVLTLVSLPLEEASHIYKSLHAILKYLKNTYNSPERNYKINSETFWISEIIDWPPLALEMIEMATYFAIALN